MTPPTSPRRPASRALLPLTIPGSWLYHAMINARNRHYDQPGAQVKLGRPVISIGNITTGGTGKSPMTAWVIRTLLERGHKPGVLMRGYLGGHARYRLDPEYDGPPLPRAVGSDEYLEMLFRFGDDFPVAPDPDRIRGAKYLQHHPEIDVFVLDDGFQHRRVARDLDIVLIDATQQTFAQRLLPAGHLREPLENLKRADAVIVMRAGEVNDLLACEIKKHHGKPPLAWANHRWARLDRFHGGDEPLPEPVESLAGMRIMTVLGVGNPGSIERQAEAAGATIASRFPARDHQLYDAALAGRMRAAASDDGVDAILTTTKDWVKLRTLIDWSTWTTPLLVPRLEIKFVNGEDALMGQLLETIKSWHRNDESTPPTDGGGGDARETNDH